MQLLPDGYPADLYGCWNMLAAFGSGDDFLGAVEAHDEDFFPESVLDYTEALRGAVCDWRAQHPPTPYPVRIDIDVTQVCNANCTFCFSRRYQTGTYRGHSVPYVAVERIIAEAAANGTRTIRYCGGGEPTVHKNIYELMRLPHRYGLNSCLITNGDFFGKNMMDEIFEFVDHLRWSVNAAHDKTRIQIHRPNLGANPLSTSLRAVEELVRRRERERSGMRKPMIWATYLVLPENVAEIGDAITRLRDVGVDSVLFRPVYHGLSTPWTPDGLKCLHDVMSLWSKNTGPRLLEDGQSRFLVFVPRRLLDESACLRPSDEFDECLSRRLRTALEAVEGGLALQICGAYRGSGPHSGQVVTDGNDFSSIWKTAQRAFPPRLAPADCCYCIDVSMNITLNFVRNVLLHHPHARFQRAWADASELANHAEAPTRVHPQ